MIAAPRPLGRVRSALFVPAVREDVLAKLPGRGADVVIVDLEDATPPGRKEDARRIVRCAVPDLVAAGCVVTVRINAPSTAWCADDVALALTAELAAVVVPKVERLAELDDVAGALDAAGLQAIGVVAGIETALGLADARELLAHPRVVGGYFGAEDFVADMGGVRRTDNAEVAFARAQIALAGRLAGVPVLDQIVADVADDQRFDTEAAHARALGFAGKLCIHPRQVAFANEAFVPSGAEVDRARRLLAAHADAASRGLGAVVFEGQMIDEPLAAQARRIVALEAG